MSEKIGLQMELDYAVDGEGDVERMNEVMQKSLELQKQFAEAGDYGNASQEIQKYQQIARAVSDYTMALSQMKRTLYESQIPKAEFNSQVNYGRRAEQGDYSSKSMQFFDTERKQAERTMGLSGYRNRDAETSEQLGRYGLDGKRGIENAQKNYRREEILRIYERLGVLNDTMDDLSESMEKAKEKNDLAGISRLSMAGKDVSAEKMSLESKLNRLLNEEKKENDGNNLGKYFGLKELGQVFKFAGDIAQAGYTYRQDMANGNVIGASRREGTSIASSVGNAATAVGGGLMATGVAVIPGAILAGLGMGTNFVSRLIEGKGQASDAEAQAYMNNFDAKYGALRSFREVGGNEAANTKAANEIFSELAAASIGTGLDAGAISQLVQEAARQGVGETRAFEIASNAGKWNQATGANVDTMLRLQGMAERYGLGQDVISTAYGGLKASGMQKAQLDEFLNGLQGVIEDGISNGYLKSADDIAAQMTMFASLSDNNPLWQGQNGANKITQMNAGLSGATEMGSAAQSIAMGSAKTVVDRMSGKDFEEKFGRKKTGTYLDYEMALQNPSGAIYGQVLKDVKSYSGGNVAAQKEFLQQIFGITSTGTLLDLINMTDGTFSESAYKNVIDENKMTPNVKTEQTIWADSMGRISESLNKIGEGEWKENVRELNDEVKKYLSKAISKEVGGNVDVNKAVLETGVDEKTAKKAAEYSEENFKEIVDVIPNVDDVNGGWNLKTGMAANSLAGIGEFAKAVSSSTALDISTIVPFLNSPNLDGNNLYSKLYYNDIGKENLDNIFKDMVGRFAYADDGQVGSDEVAKAINYVESRKGKDVMRAYESGDEAAFISALEKALENAFRRSLPTELNVYSKDF